MRTTLLQYDVNTGTYLDIHEGVKDISTYQELDEDGERVFKDGYTDVAPPEEMKGRLYQGVSPIYDKTSKLWTESTDFLVMKDEAAINAAREAKRSELNAECKQAIEAGFKFQEDSFTFRVDPDQSNITQAMLLFQMNPNMIIDWRTANDTTVQFDKTTFLDFAMAAQVHKQTQLATCWDLKDQLPTATTIEAIEAISWIG